MKMFFEKRHIASRLGTCLLLVVHVYCSSPVSRAQTQLSKRVTLVFDNAPIETILNQIQSRYSVNFSYSNTFVNLNRKISIKCDNETLENVLDKILARENISFLEKNSLVILKPRPQNADKFVISGKISNSDGEPIPYAAIMFQNTGKGIVCDVNGFYKILIKKTDLIDTLVVSSLGFETKKMSIANFRKGSTVNIFLHEKHYELPQISILSKKMKSESAGNNSFLSLGSFYIDTHGQQTVLFIENKKKKRGIISSISLKLSKSGNTHAPFRVRFYELDTASGKPGKDMLREMIIAKPEGKSGKFTLDLSIYDISVPEQGFFAGIEGVYSGKSIISGDEENFPESENIEYNPESVSYGQQLCYSRARGKNTWHYSLAGKWFQLEKNNFNVMISVDLKIEN